MRNDELNEARVARNEIEKFKGEIETTFANCKTTLNLGKNDSIMLSVHISGKLFVLEYRSNEGFGVDQVEDSAHGWVPGYRNVYTNFEQASKWLRARLEEM